MKKLLAIVLAVLTVFSMMTASVLAAPIRNHTCHQHTAACYSNSKPTCGVAQHPHTAACCTKAEHVHSDACNTEPVYRGHTCSASTGCVTGGCDGNHHTSACYDTIEVGDDLSCPPSHFDESGAHKPISCPINAGPSYILICRDPKHHAQSSACKIATTKCAHTNCGPTCGVCYTAGGTCSISEHTHGDGKCSTAGCKNAHHTSACYDDILICTKKERSCNNKNCPVIGEEDQETTNPTNPVKPNTPTVDSTAPADGAFHDVRKSDYYFNAVEWAVENGITEGTSATKFGPNVTCTRAQAVTFLWRASGSPMAQTNTAKFKDVPSNSYYYDAVQWAVEQGITKGATKTSFAPDAQCTRGQIAAFLWRTAGNPASNANFAKFSDVNPGDYYYDAVLWAVENGITNGATGTTFAPNAQCTRAQIVTFLYRFLGE